MVHGSEPDPPPIPPTSPVSRRTVLRGAATGLAAGAVATPVADPAPAAPAPESLATPVVDVALTVNGRAVRLQTDARVTLLDALRERLGLTGAKKGCDRGQCGACTVHLDGRRVLSCLTLVATTAGRRVTTVEGLANGDELHPVQQAFIECDAFQCGFCTPGQIMSAVALLDEGHTGSDDEIREYLSGNLCRCGAYEHIVAAVRTAAGRSGAAGIASGAAGIAAGQGGGAR